MNKWANALADDTNIFAARETCLNQKRLSQNLMRRILRNVSISLTFTRCLNLRENNKEPSEKDLKVT